MLRPMVVEHRGPFDREVLADEQCRSRLELAALARVLISVRCMPAALPVFIHVMSHHVLIASEENAVIDAARRGDVLAVQVDGTDDHGVTWSVQATGVAHLPTTGDVLTLAGESSRLSPALERGATLIAIPLTIVSGESVRWTFPGI